MPRDAQIKAMLAQFDWEARSRVEDAAGGLAGAALVIHVHPAWALAVAAFLVVSTALYFYREAPLELSVRK